MLLPVEVAVAVAGGALEGFEGSFVAAGHELAAAVGDVAADVGGVVLEALAVDNSRVSGSGRFGSAGIRVQAGSGLLLGGRVFVLGIVVVVVGYGALHSHFLVVFTSK